MIEWHKPGERLPAENQECVLMSHGMNIAGPIMWKPYPDSGGAWIDLFATAQAGALYSTDVVMLWADWDMIKPSDELIDSCPEPEDAT